MQLLTESVIEHRPRWTLAVNRNQTLLGKVMIVLRRPCRSLTDLRPQEWIDLHVEIRRVSVALEQLFSPDQVNVAFLMNQDDHVHAHVVPRYASRRTWGGHTFTDPHWGEVFGPEQLPLSDVEVAALADELRDVLVPPVAAR